MRELVQLVSTEKTGYFYVVSKNKKKTTDKLRFKKYDPKARKHVWFEEKKLPSGKKK